MTVGSRTSGSRTLVSTSVGKGYVKQGYLTKSWSGADSPSVPNTSWNSVKSASPRRAVVRTPQGLMETELTSPFDGTPRVPSREERFRLNHYSCDISISTDNVLTFPGDWGTVRTGTGENTGYGAYTVLSDNAWNSNDDLALIGRLREEIAGSSFNLAVTSAESLEAFRMITNAASRIYSSFRQIKRGNFKKAATLLTKGTPRRKISDRTVASNWLELQYGWLPLLNDVYSGAQYLAEYGLRRRSRRYSVRLSKRPTAVKTVYYSNVTASALHRGQLIAYISEVDETKLIGLTDPLSVIWELVPYSFVADWFLPVGDYLSARALSSAITGKFVKTLTQESSGRTNGEIWVPISPPQFSGWTKGLNTSRSTKSVRRTVMDSLQVPLPSVIPISEALGWKRMANAVALLRTAL